MLVGQQIGPFEIEKELGSGAMGTVYRAKFHRSEEKIVPVALKVVALGLLGNEGAMARFEREASILKQLRHPHIVRLIAHGKINKQNPYIAMEFIDGEALDRVLARRGKLSWEEVLDYGKQLCEALQYAHDKGIIHRDLKPSNLMISSEGALKLTDFGIAKDTDVTALTGANSTIGTAAYMSPEQCKGDRNLSNKSDLYSLGVVFYELLTGKKPFIAETTVEMFLKHVNERAPRIGKFVQDLPPKFESLILQLLEKDKDNRPIDAAWVRRMLHEIDEDSFMRKSAGLVKAEERTSKLRNQDGEKMDEADKEAARALRGKKRKAKKKESAPLLEQKWLQALLLILALLGIAGGAYYLIKPTPPDKLYAQIDSAKTPEDRLVAARKFLESHGAKGGELVDKAALVFREEVVREREKQFNNRFAANLNKPTEKDDTEAYQAVWLALEYERDGRLNQAEIQWLKVKSRFPDEAKLPYPLKEEELAKARWGWLAEKRLADIASVKLELEKLKKTIADARLYELPLAPDKTNPESLAIKILRLSAFGDHDRAARDCDTLIGLTEKDPDKRKWFLLASSVKQGLNKTGDGAANSRLKRLDHYLDETEVQAKAAEKDTENGVPRRDVRTRCREVVELYSDDDEKSVRSAVDRAEQIAKRVAK